VTEIDNAIEYEWAYVAATFDNVVVLSTGYPLTVTKSGTGSGTVTSSLPGINCGSDCGEGYSSGTNVTLTATPGASSTFAGWSGCDSTNENECMVTMNAARSVTATFQIVPPPQPPPPPVLYLPSTGEPGVSLTPTLSWYASAGATSYGVQVSKYDSFSILDIDQSGITATSYGIPSGKLSGNTKYYWRVNATNVGGTSAWSSPYFYFYTTVAAPAIPTLASPANGATGVSITPTLSWNASTGAGYYGLQVATDPGFTSIVVSQIISVPTTSYPMPAGKLLNGTTYYWRVYAADIDLGASDWSDIWHFTTVSAPAGPPAPPTLVSPNNGQTQVPTNPTLTWNASTGATSYQLQVSIDPSFQTGTTVFYPSGTSQPISGLSNNTTYYWRVTDNSIPDNWSAIWSFITEASFGVPFIGAGGMLDPDWDKEVDGIDDTFEQNTIYTDPTKKTIFIRPKIEIRAPDPSTGFAGEYQRWADFKDIYFPNSPAGRANIPPFTNANVEIVVIGDLTNPYPPMQDINYAPAADSNFTANSHYGADIIDIIFKPNAYCTSANVNFGHPSFDSSYAAGPRWVWDTKGFTSPGGRYGYGTVEIYGLPHENYFNEGAYTSIAVGQGPITTSGGPPTCNSGKCYNFGNESPMNLSGAVPPSGRPDTTVEFNTISFNKNSTPPGAITSVGAKGKEYYREHVYRRTIAHELGHALGMAHCSNPACIMNGDSIDWDMKNFGTGGNCTHDPSVLIHNGPATPRAPLLVSPAKGAQIANPNPNPITLTWNRFTSSGATSYQLQVSGANSSNFSTKLADVTLSGSATSYAVTIPKRASYANYYWQVRGCSVIGGTTSCGPWQPSTPTPQFFKTN
jgi:hypothetical protein